MTYVALISLILLETASAAGGGPDANTLHGRIDRELINDIIYCVFTDDYDAALVLCDSVIRSCPDEPAGYFFRAYALMTEMTEDQDRGREHEFLGALDTVESLAARLCDTGNGERRAWGYWYIGNVWAHRSLREARFGSSTSAYKLAKKARTAYTTCLALDSTFYDAYAGLGAIHYWKSAGGGLLRTFGLIHDEREKGIAELRIALDSSDLSRETVRKTLITILNDFGRYDEAIACAETLLIRYPGSRSFLWGASWAHYNKGDFNQACAYFKRLRAVLADRPGNYIKLIACDAQIVRCLEKLDRKDEARAWAAEALTCLPYVAPAVHDKQKDDIKYLTKIAGRR